MQMMKKGDIFVAETTAPELMVACEKAAAILQYGRPNVPCGHRTRELGIPCIVGVKMPLAC